ncbi:MAG TPA: flavin reductase family protein [Acidimicrobiales bacterium]|nr:flavin reductase family protein [Acidimicrobiales bacterium]
MTGGPTDPTGPRPPGGGAPGGVVGPVPEGRDPVDYDRMRRRALWSLPTGLYLIGSRALLGGALQWNLMTASLVVQLAVEPKLVGVSVDRLARTYELVAAGGAFSVCLLGRDDRALVRRFVKPVDDVVTDGEGRVMTMNGEAVVTGSTGSPVLARSPAWLDCSVRHQIDLGSHVLFVGEVVEVGGAGLEGSGRTVADVLRMEDTRMSYGG